MTEVCSVQGGPQGVVLRVPGTGRGLTENPAATGCPSSSLCGADPYGAKEAHAATAGTER